MNHKSQRLAFWEKLGSFFLFYQSFYSWKGTKTKEESAISKLQPLSAVPAALHTSYTTAFALFTWFFTRFLGLILFNIFLSLLTRMKRAESWFHFEEEITKVTRFRSWGSWQIFYLKIQWWPLFSHFSGQKPQLKLSDSEGSTGSVPS